MGSLRNNQDRAFRDPVDRGVPGLLPFWDFHHLWLGPFLQFLCTHHSPVNGDTDLAEHRFHLRLSKVSQEGCYEDVSILLYHPRQLKQLVTPPCQGPCHPLLEGRAQCLLDLSNLNTMRNAR